MMILMGGSGEIDLDELNLESGTSDLTKRISMFADGMLEERQLKAKEEFIEELSQFSGTSDRKEAISLNKAIVEAQTADEVLEVTAEAIWAVAKGLKPLPLTLPNIATALHWIAKNMEKVSMTRTQRWAFSRQRYVYACRYCDDCVTRVLCPGNIKHCLGIVEGWW